MNGPRLTADDRESSPSGSWSEIANRVLFDINENNGRNAAAEFANRMNMETLFFFNCDNELTGKAVITWEKGKVDVSLIEEIFKVLHRSFTGC